MEYATCLGPVGRKWSLLTLAIVAAMVTAPCRGQLFPAEPATVEPAAAHPATQPASTQPAAGGSEGESHEVVKMTQPGIFIFNFQDSDLRLALRLLALQGKKNIIVGKDVSGKVTADLYNVTFKEALDAVLRTAGGFVYQEKGNFIYVMTPAQLDEEVKAEQKMEVRMFRLFYVTAADAKTLITPLLSKDGSIAMAPAAAIGIAPSKTDTGGNSYAVEDVLVVKDYEDNIRHIDETLKDLDVKPDQVLVEATILSAKLNETTALGIDFNTLAGLNFSSFNSTTGNPTEITSGMANVVPATPGNLGALPMNGRYDASVNTSFNAAAFPSAGGLSLGFLRNNIAVFLRALEGVTNTTVLANPKLLIINKQRGEVLIGNRDGYLTTTVTATVSTQTVEFLETGTRLIVRPFIGRNGIVRMEIHPEDSSGSVAAVGGTSTVVPSETTAELTTNVLVHDGHTLVIGGLFRESTVASRSQVPVAGNIPVLGTLFRSTSDVTERKEIIILLTPRIIKQEPDESASERLKDDAERMRIGARKDVQWFAHDRLSQAYMRQARQDMANGHRAFALWNVDMALSMNHQMDEAIQLKEKLSDNAYWADQSRTSAARYVIQRMIMNELGRPASEAVMPDKPFDGRKIDPEVRKAFGFEPRAEEVGRSARKTPQESPATAPAGGEEPQPQDNPQPRVILAPTTRTADVDGSRQGPARDARAPVACEENGRMAQAAN